MGSSPPARGPRPARRVHHARRGLIPACAGTTLSQRALAAKVTAHPRLRGDHSITFPRLSVMCGSSPPARGPRPGSPLRWCWNGLIPACAGTTGADHEFRARRRAHPRLRGDHQRAPASLRAFLGSSPPARGPRIEVYPSNPDQGLIPACAGTTPHVMDPVREPRAHPRLRGDHYSGCYANVSITGSSPPARGPLCVGRLRGL